MDKYQCVAVRLEDKDHQKNIELYESETEEGFKIETTIDGMEICADGEGYFETFQRCQDKILDLGYGLKCNGSRINAVQSNLMSSCEKMILDGESAEKIERYTGLTLSALKPIAEALGKTLML